ncbi:unnamed protein product [Diamesa serratosioi]
MQRFIVLVACIAAAQSAVIYNSVTETPRIHSSEQLLSSIINNCLDGETMSCLKSNVLTYLDTKLGLQEENARAFDEKNVDKVIFDRVSRVLASNEFKVELPKLVFGNTIVSYRADRGIDFEMNDKPEARGHLLKKKLLFPVLLLLKLKMKALMPIFVAIIGLKATKALILSKLAITLVLGFIILQLVKKTGMAMPMSMMPMMPAMPADTYGTPSTPATPDTSYGPSAWDSSAASSSYSRVWEPQASSHNLAYNSYYPSSSSSNTGSTSTASSSSSSPSAAAQAY